MKELLDKLTSYNLFNYLLPGVVFVALATKITHYSFVQENIVLAAFLYYFIGLVISRVGSLLIEPALRRLSFIKFAEYADFVAASKKDTKIEVLSEANNTYRTLCSLLLSLLILKGYEIIEEQLIWLESWGVVLLIVALFIMFLFSYRKQTSYITRRIEANK